MYIKSTMESTYPHKYRNQQVRSRLKEEIILFLYNRNNQCENVAEKTISLHGSNNFIKYPGVSMTSKLITFMRKCAHCMYIYIFIHMYFTLVKNDENHEWEHALL